jgi:hypothetical protein
MSWFRKPKPPRPSPTEVTAELRKRALAALEEQRDGDTLGGIVVDWGFPEATASIVALADGTASLYLSSGGGVIGGGGRAAVRDAADALRALAQRMAGAIAEPDDSGVPAPGSFRFHIVTGAGARSATATVEELGRGAHPLSPLFAATQSVITALREVSPG